MNVYMLKALNNDGNDKNSTKKSTQNYKYT